jgi:hypothetical protein
VTTPRLVAPARVLAGLLAVAAGVGSTLAPATAGAAAAAAQPAARGAVIVVGVPALRWADASEQSTPTLWRLAGEGAVGSLSVRAARRLTSPVDGWVTFGAGNRATGRREDGPDEPALIAGPTSLSPVIERNDDLPFDATVGAVGTALQRAGVPRIAFGARAALGLAAPTAAPEWVASRALAGELPAAVARNAVVAIELPHLVDATTPEALAAMDAELEVIAASRRQQDTLLLMGLSDRIGPEEQPHLRVALALGPSYTGGRLGSALTRRDGFVQLIDAGPTVLALTGADRLEGVVGQPWRRVGGRRQPLSAQVGTMVDADRAAQGYRRYVPPFFLTLFLAQVLLYGFSWWLLRRRPAAGRRGRVLAVTRGAALAFAAVPAATYLAQLVPWWRHSLGWLIAVVAAIDLALYAVAALGPWRHRTFGSEGAVAGITMLVIGVDLLTGARLQLSSLAGYSPIVAGRFAGVGNVGFAVFATSALLLAAALCIGRSRRAQVAIVVVVGVVAVVIDGMPIWGSDFGGVLALIPGFAVLGLLVTGTRISVSRAVAIAAASVVVVAAFALLDYARPAASQTHLGRFVGDLLDGGASAVIERKARANLRLLTRSVLTLVVPLAVLFVSVVLLRPTGGLQRAFDRAPAVRAGLVAVMVMGIVGFLVNDSGVAVPALALTVAVPIALAASLSAGVSPDR